ncbi:unnamed protein product, partial [Mesorhabditis belari]|uniref:Serine/threonine-protein phosphatase n=1 Tax=Mesorhabditis belari TaxID=2138241 RepID=A0AAF3FBR2_9BILA
MSSNESGSDRDEEVDTIPPPPENIELPVHLPTSEIWEHSFVAGLLKRIFAASLVGESDSQYNRAAAAADSFQKSLNVKISYDEAVQMCNLAQKSLMRQKMIVRLKDNQLPLTVVGDIHSNIIHLRRIFGTLGWPGEGNNYLFLGDYVDRGSQGVETMCLLLALQYRYPTRVHILRGNHEEANTTLGYGFYDECRSKFPQDNQGHLIWRHFIDVFGCLPAMAIISEKIVCMHGGLSPYMDRIEDLDQIERPCSVPAYGILCDTVWSDPDPDVTGWRLSKRWVSFAFGGDVIEDFCKRNNFDMIIRAHQITRPMFRWGYRWFTNGRLVTIFSSTNYQNNNNNAAVASISTKLRIHYVTFRCRMWDEWQVDNVLASDTC